MKKVTVLHRPTVTNYTGGTQEVSAQVTTQTSWGSVAASAGGMVGSITPFLPPPYQLVGGILAGILGVVATKLP